LQRNSSQYCHDLVTFLYVSSFYWYMFLGTLLWWPRPKLPIFPSIVVCRLNHLSRKFLFSHLTNLSPFSVVKKKAECLQSFFELVLSLCCAWLFTRLCLLPVS
jgi:hypothetical protein